MRIFTYRVRFTKLGRMKFLSHHDLMRLFQRAMRRADLPIRFTEGAKPRPILSFPVALSIGVESLDEVMQLELSSWVSPRRLGELLNRNFPDGVKILEITESSRRERFEVEEVVYEIIPQKFDKVFDKIREISSSKEIKISREESKLVNVRPFILDVSMLGDKLQVKVKITPTGTIKIDELLDLLGSSIEHAKITKIKTILAR